MDELTTASALGLSERVNFSPASGVPRAIIPPPDGFVLTPPPIESEPERCERMLRELQKRFGGRVTREIRPMPWEREQQWAREVHEEREAKWLADLNIEPDWGRYGFRGRVGKLLWERGLRKKAIRFISCNKCGRPGVCRLYPQEHKFFVPHGCEVVFCRECQQEVRRELFGAYLAVILAKLDQLGGIPPGWVLARINFTLRSDGSEITPERVKKTNAAVAATLRTSVGSRRGYGALYLDEVGFELNGRKEHRKAEGLNLHCHGLYLGPRLDWEKTRDLWARQTRKKFGTPSTGFYIKKVRMRGGDLPGAVRHALNHMLKYVSKPPAVTPDRLASLIAAFDGAKRVHSLGLFYGKKPKQKKKECPCPKCRAVGVLATISFEGRELPNGGIVPRLLPLAALREGGYEALTEAGRAAVLTLGETRAP